MRTLSRLASLLPVASLPVALLMTGAVPAQGRAAAPPPPLKAAEAAAGELAAGMLAAFRPPPGAVRLPCPATKVLVSAPEHPAVANLVTRTGYWRAPGRPLAVLGWIQAHHPAGLALTGGGEITYGRDVVGIAEFSAPAEASAGHGASAARQGAPTAGQGVEVAYGRTLLVSAARTAGGTAIRVDAQVTWLPAKPVGERVPAGARMLIVEYLPGSGPVEEITDPVVIRRVAAAANALPLAATGQSAAPGAASCPADFGRRVRLTFRAGRGSGPPALRTARGVRPPALRAAPGVRQPALRAARDARVLAVLTAQLGGCGIVTMTVGGREYPALGDASALADALPGRPLDGGRLVHEVRRTAQQKLAGVLRRAMA